MADYIGKICSYCLFPIEDGDEVVFCSECKKPHHKKCWESNGGCTKYGCHGLMLTREELDSYNNWMGVTPVVKSDSEEISVDKSQGGQFNGFFTPTSDKVINSPWTEPPKEEKTHWENFEEKARLEREKKDMEELAQIEENASKYRAQSAKKRVQEKRAKVLITIVAVFAAILLIGGAVGGFLFIRESEYQSAMKHYNKQEFEEARDTFASLKKYKDSAEYTQLSNYNYALSLMDQGSYKEAEKIFLKDKYYKDSKDMADLCVKEQTYQSGLDKLDAGELKDAKKIFKGLNGFRDSDNMIKEAVFREAIECYEKEDYAAALELFESVGDYKDTSEYMQPCYYHYAVKKLKLSEYETAYNYLSMLPRDYTPDTNDLYEKAGYNYALFCLTNKDYDTAEKVLATLTSEDIEVLYRELYKWRVNIVFNTEYEDFDTSLRTFNVYDLWYVHYTVEGGPPDGETKLKVKYVFSPNNQVIKDTLDGTFKSGDQHTTVIYLDNPEYGVDGKIKAYAYDGDGNLIGEAEALFTTDKE